MQFTTVNLANDYPPINPAIILELFQQFRSSNDEQIQNASKQLMYYQENFPAEVLSIASGFLTDEENDNFVYHFSAIYISNVLSPARYSSNSNNRFWRELEEENRNSIKQAVLNGLMFEDRVIRNLCAKAISLIVKLEVTYSHQPDLFDPIFQIIQDDQTGEWAKLGGIQALTEILSISTPKGPPIPQGTNIEEICSKILQITTQTLQNQKASIEFKNLSADCLRVSLPIIVEGIQDQIDTLLEFIISILPIGVSAYRLLLKFAKIFYDQLVPDPIQLIFNEVSKDITSDDPTRRSLSINFWYRFSKFEFKKYSNMIPCPVFHNISNKLSEAFSQPFLEYLPNAVSEFDISLFGESNENDLSDLIIRCLNQFAQIPDNQEAIVNTVVEFYQGTFQSEDPIYRYSAILSLLSIVFINEQPQLTDFFITNINHLIELISSDPSTNVRCVSILILGKILTHQMDSVSEELLSQVMSFLTELLEESDTTILASICKMLSSLFKNYGENLAMIVYTTICPILINMLDRPNLFDEPFFTFLNQALVSLIKSGPVSYNDQDTYFIYINTYIEIGTRLENAINETRFPDQTSKEKMISFLCSVIRNVHLKFKSILYENYENFAEITNHVLDIVFDFIDSYPEMWGTYIFGVIATMVTKDPAQIIYNTRLDQVSQTTINIYTSSESPEIILTTAGILKDLIYLHPKYFSDLTFSDGETEKSFITNLLEVTLKFFNTVLLIDFQVYIFMLIGDIIGVIDVLDVSYAEEIFSGLFYLNYLQIPKTEPETNLQRLQSMFYVSSKLISKYNSFDPDYFNHKRIILTAAALDEIKNKYEDETLIGYYFQFLDAVLDLPDNFFKKFSNFIGRPDQIILLNNMPQNLSDRAKRIRISISRKTGLKNLKKLKK